jgi:hypothetical protein
MGRKLPSTNFKGLIMSTLTNVFSAHRDSTGTIYSGATNLAGYQLASGGVAGEIVFRDGGSGGTVLLRVNITINTAVISTLIPGNGIRFNTDIHVTLPSGASLTIFCG